VAVAEACFRPEFSLLNKNQAIAPKSNMAAVPSEIHNQTGTPERRRIVETRAAAVPRREPGGDSSVAIRGRPRKGPSEVPWVRGTVRGGGVLALRAGTVDDLNPAATPAEAGTSSIAMHFGQRPRLPAYSSGTLKRYPHSVHCTASAMALPVSARLVEGDGRPRAVAEQVPYGSLYAMSSWGVQLGGNRTCCA
jgi:hypothetical protein